MSMSGLLFKHEGIKCTPNGQCEGHIYHVYPPKQSSQSCCYEILVFPPAFLCQSAFCSVNSSIHLTREVWAARGAARHDGIRMWPFRRDGIVLPRYRVGSLSWFPLQLLQVSLDPCKGSLVHLRLEVSSFITARSPSKEKVLNWKL